MVNLTLQWKRIEKQSSSNGVYKTTLVLTPSSSFTHTVIGLTTAGTQSYTQVTSTKTIYKNVHKDSAGNQTNDNERWVWLYDIKAGDVVQTINATIINVWVLHK